MQKFEICCLSKRTKPVILVWEYSFISQIITELLKVLLFHRFYGACVKL